MFHPEVLLRNYEKPQSGDMWHFHMSSLRG